MPTKFCILFLLFLGNLFFSNAQTKKSITTTKISETIAIDAELNEEAWKNADIATDFVMFEPDNGQPINPKKKTEVKILYTDEAIYVGALLFDDDNDGIPDTDEYCKSSISLPATNTTAGITEQAVPAGWTITNSSPDIATTAYSIYGSWIGGCSGTAPAAPNGHKSWVNFYSNTQEAFKTTLSGLVVGRTYILKAYYAKFASTAAFHLW